MVLAGLWCFGPTETSGEGTVKLALRGPGLETGRRSSWSCARVRVGGANRSHEGETRILMRGLRVGGLEGGDPVTGHWTAVLCWARD